MYLNQRDLKRTIKVFKTVGAIEALEDLRGYLPNSTLDRKIEKLEGKVKNLLDLDENVSEEGEDVIRLRVKLPGGKYVEKPQKKAINLRRVLFGNDRDFDEEDRKVNRIIRGMIDDDDFSVVGKIVKNL